MDITGLASSLTEALGGFEPEGYPAAECARLAEQLAATGKACAAAGVMAAARAAALGAHKEAGFSDPSAWVANQAGTTGRQAKDALETAGRLEGLPGTKQALLSGQISLSQAHEIARSEGDSPGQEATLLRVAPDGDLTKLRDEVRDHKLASTPPEKLHQEQLKARHLRTWRDGLGLVRLEAALPPESGIPLVNRIERLAARLRRERRGESGPEPFERLAAEPWSRSPQARGRPPPRAARSTSSSSATSTPGAGATPTRGSPATWWGAAPSRSTSPRSCPKTPS